jgi:hypothetical protein
MQSEVCRRNESEKFPNAIHKEAVGSLIHGPGPIGSELANSLYNITCGRKIMAMLKKSIRDRVKEKTL